MTTKPNRHDELITTLRVTIEAAMMRACIKPDQIRAVRDELLGDHRTGLWPDIEEYGSGSWMVGTYVGVVDGLKAAQTKLRERAATLFTDGKDTEAMALRSHANALDVDIAKAEAEAKRARTERGG